MQSSCIPVPRDWIPVIQHPPSPALEFNSESQSGQRVRHVMLIGPRIYVYSCECIRRLCMCVNCHYAHVCLICGTQHPPSSARFQAIKRRLYSHSHSTIATAARDASSQLKPNYGSAFLITCIALRRSVAHNQLLGLAAYSITHSFSHSLTQSAVSICRWRFMGVPGAKVAWEILPLSKLRTIFLRRIGFTFVNISLYL